MFELLEKGGLLIWPILGCSIIGMTIFFERLFVYRRVQNHLAGANSLGELNASGEIEKFKKSESHESGRVAIDRRILKEAMNIESSDRETVEMVLVRAVDREVTILARTLSTLAVLASVSPLLGLLGTVIGMIKAFYVVESMGGSVNASVLAGGIWEAMLTTAFGLLAAIPLLFFHNHLENRLASIQSELQDMAISFMKLWSKNHAEPD